MKELFTELENYFEEDFITEFRENYYKFLNAKTYDDFLNAMDYETVRIPKGSSEEGKAIKGQIVDLVKEFKENYLNFESEEEILKGLESTKNHQMILFEILEQFDSILEHYKQKNQIYTFQDIARMAIKVVEENPDIQEELTNSFDEILVDEYQDTSDIQEKFISLISCNNVYMVGDIKQSIYRFRNANPDIFKEKYKNYQDNKNGIKIDLLKNFRSRKEVLDDINLLFNPIMDEKIGGAAYPESHQMVFGNTSYEEQGKTNQDYHMNVLTYNPKELKGISKAEEEAFIIGNDILNKLKTPFQVFDKDTKTLRVAEYKDFVILLDRGTNFDTYKKVFEYLQIPLQILQDESFQEEDDSYIFKNLLKFILCVKEEDFGSNFEYTFVSLSRSYLYPLSDSEIYERFTTKTYQDTKVYQDALELSNLIDSTSLSEFVRIVFKKISYEEKILKTSRIHSKRVREEYFYNLSKSFEKLGNTIYDFVDYLEKIFESEMDLTFNGSSKSTNSCRIMTIHKSKGLEFPICYFAGLSSPFNLMELNERILFDKEYGLILPVVNESYKDTILKILLKQRVRLEEISEKIRLFYVATTRTKEEMIFVTPELEDEYYENVVPDYIRLKYNSFDSLLKSIMSILLPFTKGSDIEVSKDYLKTSKIPELTLPRKEKYTVNDLVIESKEVEEAHYSKEVHSIPTEEEKEIMAFGTEVHEILEELDFSNPILLDSVKNTYIKKKIQAFLDSDLMKDKLSNTMYKEYEFYVQENNTLNHGIIDLLIDNGDSYTIIDYKLKNIDDLNYNKQLNGYRAYIENLTGKKVDCYLYSILTGNYREVENEN